jgi:hypothetical protein
MVDYGKGEGIKRFVAYALQNIRPVLTRAAYTVVSLEGPIITTPERFVPKVFPLRQHVRTPRSLRRQES